MVRYGFPEGANSRYKQIEIDDSEYIEASMEPFDGKIDANMSAEIEIEMAETLYDMRREFKRQNKRLRKLYSTKDPRRFKMDKTTRGNHISKRRALAQ